MNPVSWIEFFSSFEFARIALVGTVLVSIISGLLSPLIILKQRAYVGDLLAHYIFPGVIGGYLASNLWHLPFWLCLTIGASLTGFLGNLCAEFFHKTLRLPQDAASVVTITGFFGTGVIAISKMRGTRINLESILFGDILALDWSDIVVLGTVCLLVALCILALKRHWEAWLCDPEFARLAGFKVKQLDMLFPILITVVVLSAIFAVGGLMISALLTLPSVLIKPTQVFSWKVVVVSVLVGLVGFGLSFQSDWPVGSTIVVIGFFLVLVKGLVVRIKK